MDPYICLSLHYIEPSWNLMNWTIQVSTFHDRHTGENLTMKLQDMIGPIPRVDTTAMFIINDNAANICLAVEGLDNTTG
jgi:hypothetical protein